MLPSSDESLNKEIVIALGKIRDERAIKHIKDLVLEGAIDLQIECFKALETLVLRNH